MSVFHELSNLNNTSFSITTITNYLRDLFILIKLFISTFGAATILFGAVIAIYRYFYYRLINSKSAENVNNIRLDLARTTILGLEFFIASDVIETTITPDFQSLGILSILVVIRTILNYSLHKEVKELSTIQKAAMKEMEP
jgi:uncharacterized membrane protein